MKVQTYILYPNKWSTKHVEVCENISQKDIIKTVNDAHMLASLKHIAHKFSIGNEDFIHVRFPNRNFCIMIDLETKVQQ
jgi:hypothetical protein